MKLPKWLWQRVEQPARDKRRSFTVAQKKFIWYKQDGKCSECETLLDQRTVRFDHTERWADNGKTEVENGTAMCPGCHAMKTFTESESIKTQLR